MPTFNRDIRPLFRQMDVDHMLDVDSNFDLASYQSVKDNAEGIHQAVQEGSMPPDQRWSEDQVRLFKQWMDAGYPE